MSRRRRMVGAVVIGGLLLAATLWLSIADRDAGAPDVALSASPRSAGENAAFDPETPRDARGAAWPALPAADVPVDAIAATLQQRADAGDSRAACRLAAELIRCRQDAYVLAMDAKPGAPLSAPLARDGKLDAAIAADERMLRLAEHQKRCRALPDGLLARAGDYLARAARAGEPEAMILYLEGQHFPPTGMGHIADPGFDAWRRDAPAMAQALLRRGEPEAVFILSLAYGDDETWFGGLVPDDAVLNEAYRQLMRRLRGNAGYTRPSTLAADDLLRAHALAEDWHARHFNQRRVEQGDITRRLTLMTHRRPESSPAPCEP